MDHIITVGDIAYVIGGLFVCGVVAVVLVGILWFMAQGWNH